MADNSWWTREIVEALSEPWAFPREITDGGVTITLTSGNLLQGEEQSIDELDNEIASYPDLSQEEEERLRDKPMGDWLD